MSDRRSPNIDRILMRAKDIIWLAGLVYTLFKGIDSVAERFKNLEGVIIAQNATLGNIRGQLRDIRETLNRIEHPERYK